MKIFMANISKNNGDDNVHQGSSLIEEQNQEKPTQTQSEFNKGSPGNTLYMPGFNQH